ncbi:HET-domain-containing protein [Sporormia fimetaria CBS 119925]|uniref:HET-domain-containing protein n=1 Tax=Sporormia fimetaria CBS 119925 TaxID=1340428 RepID=A0A6A6V1B5_9PLEO|nr:HET-domain-containing protein [Sporormia fimetaria CBS 119925]
MLELAGEETAPSPHPPPSVQAKLLCEKCLNCVRHVVETLPPPDQDSGKWVHGHLCAKFKREGSECEYSRTLHTFPGKPDRPGSLHTLPVYKYLYEDLRKEASRGCYICGHIGVTVKEYFRPPPEEITWQLMSDVRDDNRHFAQLRLHILSISNAFFDVNFLLKRQHDVSDHYNSAYTFGCSTNSLGSRNQASQWLSTCLKEHPACARAVGANKRQPTRLLHIAPNESGNIRLIDTREESVSGPYVTLSHCWGNNKPLRLLRANLDQFRKGSSFSALPLTFQEAIIFTRSLGVEYIWIDSLCIIQDEDWLDDWFREASRMQDVYSGGILNLAADAALDGTQGLFRDRDVGVGFECPLLFSSGESSEPKSGAWQLAIAGTWIDVVESPLSKRGWYQQERLLAPRILHFTSKQLCWECHQHTATEVQPAGLYYPSPALKEFDWAKMDTKLILNQIWPQTVGRYTHAKLTYSGDKLVALSGISRRLQEQGKIPGRYIAGLWEVDIISQLCWGILSFTFKLQPRPTIYRAPSFAWASVDGPIGWYDWMYGPSASGSVHLAEVLDITIVPTTDDLYGAVEDGHIVLKCPLFSAQQDLDLVLKRGRFAWFQIQCTHRQHTLVGRFDTTDDQYRFVYIALCMHRQVAVGPGSNGRTRVAGLVLAQCQQKGVFRRLGYVHHINGTSDSLDDLLRFSSGSEGADLSSQDYDPTTGKHTIRII